MIGITAIQNQTNFVVREKNKYSMSYYEMGINYRLIRVIHQLTLASKNSLAPLTPTSTTSISVNFASLLNPLSSRSSPALAFRKISKNWNIRYK